MKKVMPMIEKMYSKNTSRNSTFASFGIELSIATISFFRPGSLLTDLSGRSMRNVRSMRRLGRLPLISSGMKGAVRMLETTTMKSRMFHDSFRYAFSPKMNPSAMTLTTHSMKKTMLKTHSIACARGSGRREEGERVQGRRRSRHQSAREERGSRARASDRPRRYSRC